MAWSYDNTDLDTSTSSGRLNVVRLLVGDTDTNNQQLQNEEIVLGLSENNDRVYHTAAWCAEVLASKYAVDVDTQLNADIELKYSQLYDQFSRKAKELRSLAKKVDGNVLGLVAGGVNKQVVDAVRDRTDRVRPSFWTNQFKNPPDWPDEFTEGYF